MKKKLIWVRCEDYETEKAFRNEIEKAKRAGFFRDAGFIVSYGKEIEFLNKKEIKKLLSELKRMLEE